LSGNRQARQVTITTKLATISLEFGSLVAGYERTEANGKIREPVCKQFAYTTTLQSGRPSQAVHFCSFLFEPFCQYISTGSLHIISSGYAYMFRSGNLSLSSQTKS